jgi:putative ABC transport system permease protein
MITVIIANVIISPVSYYIMKNWLEGFAYRMELTFWTFILPAVGTLIIAFLTVGFIAFKAAVANPVNSLRYE